MKITGYRSLTTRHDWGRPVGDVNGHSTGTATRVDVVVVSTDVGVEGVGVGAHPEIERIFPALEGHDPRAVRAAYDRMLAVAFKLGHNGAVFGTIGALDHALWDLKAKLAGEPLWRLLGGDDRFVPGYASGLEYALTDDELVALYERFADRGFAAGKLKGGRWLDDDRRRLGLMREVFARNSRAPALMLDANESWHRSQAVRHIAALERDFDLTWVEEPVRRWDARGLASIRQHVRTAVATGENLTGVEQIRALVDADAVDVVQVGSAWGITHFLRVAALAHAHDLPVSPIGYTTLLAPAAGAVPNFFTAEVQDFSHPVGLLVDQEIADGGIVLGDAPGGGVGVDENALEQLPPGVGWSVVSGPHARPARAGLRLVPEDDAALPNVTPTHVPYDLDGTPGTPPGDR